jgi:hypothetical protein
MNLARFRATARSVSGRAPCLRSSETGDLRPPHPGDARTG